MKNKINWYLITFVVSIFVSCQQKPLDIYVSEKGNHSNISSKDNLVHDLEKALELVEKNAGKKQINIYLENGVYYLPQTLQLTAKHSGTEKYPVNFKAINDGKVVISGGKQLKFKWSIYKNGIYQAKVKETINIDQLYVNDKRQRMARFPNAVEGKNVFDAWDLIHTHDSDFENDPLNPDRIANWENPKGAFVHAMHSYLWGDMHWLVKGKNEDGTLDLEGGWQNNRPSKMHPRYRMVENVFEELDAPGEWFYDKTKSILYYKPSSDEDIHQAKIEVVRLKHLIEFIGSKETPVRYVNIEGLVFKHVARSFMENKEQLLRSDWTTYRGGAIVFNGAENCKIDNCEFDQLGGNSIFVNNYNKEITIRSCYIHHSGANGIAFVGDPEMVRSPLFRYGDQDFENMDRTPGPKGDNYPQDCLVEDCLITLTGRDEKQTSPIQISMSYKIRVNHCSIYDVPRAGINISEGTFGGHIIENNDVFNTVLETGDHGSFNSWGRDRFWTPDIRITDAEVKKNPNLPQLDMLKKNIIRHNRWRCDHGWDIDLDDGSSWYEIYDNVLLSGGLKMREGYYRKATNNIIINNSLHPHVWYPESGDVFKSNIVFSAYRPAAMNRVLSETDKWGKELDYNLFASSDADRRKFVHHYCDSNSIVGDPLFENAAIMNYTVKENSPAFEIGFKNFPMDNFGVISRKLKAISKTPEVPQIASNIRSVSGKIMDWQGCKIKNIENLGEQSAAGLSSISGVLIVKIGESSKLLERGVKNGDVIIECNKKKIKNMDQLFQNISRVNNKYVELVLIQNQKRKSINVELEK